MSTTRDRWKDRDLIPRMQGNVARGPMGHRLVVDEHVDEPPEPSLVVEDSIREPRVASIHFIDRFGQVVRAQVDGRDAPGEFSKRVRHVDLNLGASLRNVTRLLQGPTLSCVAARRGYITFHWRKPFVRRPCETAPAVAPSLRPVGQCPWMVAQPKVMKTFQAFRGIWRDTLPNRIETSGPNVSHGSVNLDRLAFRTRGPFPSPVPTPRRWRRAVRAGPRSDGPGRSARRCSRQSPRGSPRTSRAPQG